MRAPALLLLLLGSLRLVSARTGAAGLRSLHQTEDCPIEHCLKTAEACRYVQRSGLWQCTLCAAPFKPNAALSGCVCPAGMYINSHGDCVTCDKNDFCPQGQDPLVSNKTACPKNMITLKAGAKNNGACVNKPGYRYVKTSVGPSAVACRKNEYCTGLKKQATCDKCPPNFATDIRNPVGSHTSSAVCVAPPGYHISGDTVAPCAKGEYKEDYSTTPECQRCETLLGLGITTAGEASTSPDDCNQLEPGYALVNEKGKVILTRLGDDGNNAFTKAKPCPQSYYCPGGDPSLTPTDVNSAVPKPCPSGLWTEEEGASEPSMCKVPPGHMMSANGIALCPNGEFREGFVAPEDAACKQCGKPHTADGVTVKWLSDKTVNIFQLDQDTGEVYRQIPVRGSDDCCYIQRGMGSVMVKNGTGEYVLKAMICPANFYGISAAKKYGLKATPCLACPPNMATPVPPASATPLAPIDKLFRADLFLDGTTDTSTTPTPRGTAFYDIGACRTKAGSGYAGGAAQECAKGYWAAGGDTKACTKCPFPTTTASTGTTAESLCNQLIEGYGWDALNQRYQLCPVGSYLGGTDLATTPTPACTSCTSTVAPVGFAYIKTPDVGSTSLANCSLCMDGYGAPKAGMACSSCKDGLYGPAIRTTTPCLVCPVDRTYTFGWDQGADVFEPRATSKDAAVSLDDCIADFAQTEDGAFYLDIRGGALAVSPQFLRVPLINSLDSCVTECRLSGLCVAVTFNYATLTCHHWVPPPTPAGDWSLGGLAMKAFSSSKLAQNKAKGAGVGVWTFLKTDAKNVMDAFIGFEDEKLVPSVVANAATTLRACQQACTDKRLCAGVVFGKATSGPNPGAGDPINIEAIGSSNVWTDTTQYNPDPLSTGTPTYAKACYLINGVVEPDSPKRSLVRAKPANFEHLYCPPGTYRNAVGTQGICTPCTADTFSTDSNQVGTCDAVSTCPAPWKPVGTVDGVQHPTSLHYGCGCAAGTAMNTPGTGCVACSAGTWSEPDNTLRGCRASTECPPGYVIDGATGCKKCPGIHVPNADQTACGCTGITGTTPNQRVASAVAGTCDVCEDGASWPAGVVNTGPTCNPCGTGIMATSVGSACDRLKPGYYFRNSDNTIQPCRPGHFCPGFGGAIGTQTGTPTQVVINTASNEDQGIYACPAGTTTPLADTTQNHEVNDCNQVLPGWMFCPGGATTPASVAIGFTTLTCTSTGIWAAPIFTAIIPCQAGGYCKGELFNPTDNAAIKGFTACDADSSLADGFWSAPRSTSKADCHLLSARYYWTGTAPALCPWTDFCPGGLSTTGKTAPFGNYKCAAGKSCLASDTVALSNANACSCDVLGDPTTCKPCAMQVGGLDTNYGTIWFGVYTCTNNHACSGAGGTGCDCDSAGVGSIINGDGTICKFRCP